MLHREIKNLTPTMEELALIAALRQKEIAVDSKENAEKTAELLHGLVHGQLVPVTDSDAELISMIRSHDIKLDDQSLEALSYLEELDPAKVSYFLTFYVCQLAHEIEDQDENFFSNDGVQAVMRLQQFLLQWNNILMIG